MYKSPGIVRGPMGGAICILLLMLAGCATPKPTVPPEVPEPRPYRIAAGDTLEILVWREDQVSGRVDVRPDGIITVPLAGEVRAAGSTPEELARALHDALAQFIDNPNVVVRVAVMGSRRYFVVGNVRSPGMFDLRADLTFLQAMAVAGGFTDFAARGQVRIIRVDAPALTPDYEAIVRGDAPDVRLEANDTIVVP